MVLHVRDPDPHRSTTTTSSPSSASSSSSPRLLSVIPNITTVTTTIIVIIATILLVDVASSSPTELGPTRRPEPHLSFSGPGLDHEDGVMARSWLLLGNALVTSEQARLAPSLREQHGSVWTRNPVALPHWEVEVTLRVTGTGAVGADGMALWYTANQGSEGPVFGAADRWNGLGVFLDSFDNDGMRNNPMVLALVNDGTQNYNHQTDGITQAQGNCVQDFRNKPYPVRVKVSYYRSALTVMVNSGLTPSTEDYEPCVAVHNVVLPPQGYFGISAATGGLADDHDVLSWQLYSLVEPGQEEPPVVPVPVAEGQTLQEAAQAAGPEGAVNAGAQEATEAKEVEWAPLEAADEQREGGATAGVYVDIERSLQQLLEGQNKVHMEIKQLGRSLGLVLEEQQRQVDLLAHTTTGRPGEPLGGQALEELQRHQQELLLQLSHLRGAVEEVSAHAGTARDAAAVGRDNPYDSTHHFTHIRDTLELVKRDVGSLAQRPVEQPMRCPEVPPPPTCLPPAIFLLFLALQTIVILSFLAYKNHRDAAAKKFF
ncbi:protein ERGIC-53-like isoform X2 [Lethenteron reissneri]|uniref:protein ERGIC-53-like isoform X2 n=1 Tax=Lethenteron reissneri TaxID=7753 RepID=UPI002AB72188|nr:protein ERGIC-53-like isoform X2 [Lethenteron reissneri]